MFGRKPGWRRRIYARLPAAGECFLKEKFPSPKDAKSSFNLKQPCV
jgi:hypothetical protein